MSISSADAHILRGRYGWLTSWQGRDGPDRSEAILLPAHDHDARRSHREATSVRLGAAARLPMLSGAYAYMSMQVHARRPEREEDEHAAASSVGPAMPLRCVCRGREDA